MTDHWDDTEPDDPGGHEHRWARVRTVVDLLAEVLRGAPKLPGAVCPDWPAVFAATQANPRDTRDQTVDPETIAYATTTALRLCATCPALDPCRAWLDNLTPADRPTGVVAGLLQAEPPTEVSTGRPGRKPPPVEHTKRFAALRAQGLSYRAIARATGSNPNTVRRAITGQR